eukprot:6177990-Pleurochrysis_carterae.AAC.1
MRIENRSVFYMRPTLPTLPRRPQCDAATASMRWARIERWALGPRPMQSPFDCDQKLLKPIDCRLYALALVRFCAGGSAPRAVTPPYLMAQFYGKRAKLLVLLRDPTTRLRTAFHGHVHYPKHFGQGEAGFERYAVETIDAWKACAAEHSVRWGGGWRACPRIRMRRTDCALPVVNSVSNGE